MLDRIKTSHAYAAALAFLRVAAAATFATWAADGFPLSEVTGADLEQYVQAGLAAGAALVGLNAAGGWETRYGRGSTPADDLAPDQD